MNDNRELILMIKQMLYQVKEIGAKVDQLSASGGVTPATEPILLDNYDVYRIFHVSRTTLYRWRKKKLIPFTQIQGKYFYLKEDILRTLFEQPDNLQK